jgi:probable phosphoglycerate mutase
LRVTTVVAVRHGETTWNREGRMQGWAPDPLTEAGRAQARRLGETVAARYDVDRILSSDLHRAKETTELLEAHVEAPVAFESAWREHDVGAFQGLPVDELFERFPEFGLGNAGASAARERPESGESLVDVRERVLDRWKGVLTNADPTETVLVVAHGGPIRLLLGHVKGLDVVEAITEQAQANCSINEFRHDHETGETTVVRENDADHC